MNFFRLDFKKLFILMALIIFPLILMNMKHSPESQPWFLRPFSFFKGIVQDSYSHFSGAIRSTTSLYLNLISIKKENSVLRKENAKLQAHFGTLSELKIENDRLKNLLNFQQIAPMKLLTARVIGKDLASEHNTVTINRGSSQGVKRKMAAIAIGGVVGYVIRVHAHTSQILLLTDVYSAIDSIVQRSRVRGITEGTSRNTCRLRYLQREDDVLKGDLIVTSGLNNIFPKGFPIGKIISISQKNKNSISQTIEIQPSINPLKLEEIFIVLNANKKNQEQKKISYFLQKNYNIRQNKI